MDAADTRVSVVVVSYRSRTVLGACLDSLRQETPRPEIIVVDNASDDGTGDWLTRTYPDVRVIQTGANLGYGPAANRGLAAARGQWILVLNPDTVVQKGALAELVRQAGRRPRGLFTPKLVTRDGRVNACGMVMHYTGITTCRGLGAPAATYRGTFAVDLVSGAAVMADRRTWQDLGGFDEDVFLYMEDVDLSLRARFRGYDLWCVGDAVVRHDYQLHLTPRKLRWLERHRLWVWFKLWDRRTLLGMVPALMLTGLATWAFAWGRGPAFVAARAGASLDVLLHMRRLVRSRRRFRPTKVRSDREVLAGSVITLPFAQLTRGGMWGTWLNRWTAPLYAWLARPVGLIMPPPLSAGGRTEETVAPPCR